MKKIEMEEEIEKANVIPLCYDYLICFIAAFIIHFGRIAKQIERE